MGTRLRVGNVVRYLNEPWSVLDRRVAQRLGVTSGDLARVRVVRSVLDARNKASLRYVCSVEVELDGQLEALPPDAVRVEQAPDAPGPVREPAQRPIIVGTGPAGLFCALGLLERGVRSVLLERGRPVDVRRKDVARLMRDGTLDPESNMNFGEGGAGAYTDGKLSTRVNHPLVRKVIETFARLGAPESILVEGKPHVGSDLLPGTVARLREELLRGGCQLRFQARVDDLVYSDGRVGGVRLSDQEIVESDRVVLAPGNSARELYERFAADGKVAIEAKPFALGFRAEHPQALINEIQYGRSAQNPELPPADYKLAENLDAGDDVRGVYSFCMCPGGVVVPTPTEPGLLCTNGMSNSRRSSKLANAGIVVSVSAADFSRAGFAGPLAGLAFQRHWERAAYELGGGSYRAPAQSIPDYLAGRLGRAPGRTSYHPGITHADLGRLFPAELTAALKAALRRFERKMKGFGSGEGLLLGIESRTSAPVRITRGDDLQSISLRGLYPAGEGCGYAGGIVSSALDGLRIAEHICRELE